MTDLINAPLDATERDALAWRMLEERLDMFSIDLSDLKHNAIGPVRILAILGALHDALAYRRQT